MTRFSLKHFFLSAMVCFAMILSPMTAQAEVFESHYFTVDLGNSWRVSGRPHNMEHSVNVTVVNPNAKSSINIVVGSGQIKPSVLINNLASTLKAQHAHVGPVEQKNGVVYFEFSLNGIRGFSCSATNGKDVSSITVLGNPQAGMRLLTTIKAKDQTLFPNF